MFHTVAQHLCQGVGLFRVNELLHESEVHRGLADLKGILSVYLDLDRLVAAAVAGASAPVIPPV